MWRVTMLMKRKEGLDRAGLVRDLRGDFAPSALKRGVLAGEHLKKFVVAAACNPAGGGLPDTFDASVELWFDDEGAAGDALKEVTLPGPLNEQLASFTAPGLTVAWMGEYLLKLERGGATFKLTVTGDVADGMPLPEVIHYWRDVHPVVAQTAPWFWSQLRLYAQIHGRRVPGSPIYRPLAAEVGFSGVEEFAAAYSNDEYLTIIRPDERKFSKPDNMFAFATSDPAVLLERG